MATPRKFDGHPIVERILEYPNGDEEIVDAVFPTDGIHIRFKNRTSHGEEGQSRWFRLGKGFYLRELPNG